MAGGWGDGPWGDAPWGDALEDDLAGLSLASVLPVAENVLRLEFSEAVYYSGLLDAEDGSIPSKYVVSPVGGTRGLDGTECRPVTAVRVDLVDPSHVDLVLDRPMTPYPARYSVAVTGIWTEDRSSSINLLLASAATLAVFKFVPQPVASAPSPTLGGDVANPQTIADAVNSGVVRSTNPLLGTFLPDDSGDYASDAGLASYRKRVFRRIVTVPGGFAHLGASYGAGATTYGKKLATASRRAQLAAAIEQQVLQEPETIAASCTISQGSKPGLFLVALSAQTRDGATTRLTVPVRG